MSLTDEELKATHDSMSSLGFLLVKLNNAASINASFLYSKEMNEKAKVYESVNALLAVAVRKLFTSVPACSDDKTYMLLDNISNMTSHELIDLAIEGAQTLRDSIDNPDLTNPRVEGDMRDEIRDKLEEYVDFCMKWKQECDILYKTSVEAMEKHSGKDQKRA